MHRIYGLPGLNTKQIMVLHVPWFASKPPSVVKKIKPFPTQGCAGIRTTALACEHALGASGGSDVRTYTYIDIYRPEVSRIISRITTQQKIYRPYSTRVDSTARYAFVYGNVTACTPSSGP